MKIQISTIEEQLGRQWIETAPESHRFEWVAPAVIGQSVSEVPLVWLYHAPWLQIAKGVELDIALENWSAQQRRVLHLRKQAGREVLFVNTAHTRPSDVLAALGLLKAGTANIAPSSKFESAEALILAHGLLAARPKVWELFEALEAASLMPSGAEPLFRYSLPPIAIDHLQQILDYAKLARTSVATAEVDVDEARREIESLRKQLTEQKAVSIQQAEESTLLRKELEQTKVNLGARFAELALLTNMLEDSARERSKLDDQIRQQNGELAGLKNTFTRSLTRSLLALQRKLFKPNNKASERLKKDVRLIAESGFFDAEWYSENYPDVTAAEIDPATHYVKFGGAEGRNPSVRFNTLDYVTRYPDVAEAGQNPLVHYLRFGKTEQRSIRSIEV